MRTGCPFFSTASLKPFSFRRIATPARVSPLSGLALSDSRVSEIDAEANSRGLASGASLGADWLSGYKVAKRLLRRGTARASAFPWVADFPDVFLGSGGVASVAVIIVSKTRSSRRKVGTNALLVPQGVNGIESGSPTGGCKTEYHANGCCEQEGNQVDLQIEVEGYLDESRESGA